MIIFSDLDGTLLDYESYSYEKVGAALQEIRNRRIPLILCSSKTRAEMEKIRVEMGNSDPFICENGAAVYIPEHCVSRQPAKTEHLESYYMLRTGKSYDDVTAYYKILKQRYRLSVRGFHEMSVAEVASITGLNDENVRLSMRREYSEPFFAEKEFVTDTILSDIELHGFRLSRGGRFYHLSGQNDKGAAVKEVIGIYEKDALYNSVPVVSIGIGDSANDLPMLRAVQHPFAVRKPSGEIDPELMDPYIAVTRRQGPEGWNETILDILDRLA